MRWVKLTLPPRARRGGLLITTRLSKSSLAGTARTLVAVGTCSDCSMLATTRAAAPRRGVLSTFLASSAEPAGFFGVTSAGWAVVRATAPSADGASAAVPADGRAAGVSRFWVDSVVDLEVGAV